MNPWALRGSYMLILGGIGHFAIVDMPLMIFEASFIRWIPSSLVGPMKETVVDWGILGSNYAFAIFEGFSLWVVISLFMIALYNSSIFLYVEAGHRLRLISLRLGLSASVLFLIVAVLCFIYPPVVGGVFAVVFFVFALRKEKLLHAARGTTE